MKCVIVNSFVFFFKIDIHILLYNNINKVNKYILRGYGAGWVLIRYLYPHPYLFIFVDKHKIFLENKQPLIFTLIICIPLARWNWKKVI
jgi:hypothetical protein